MAAKRKRANDLLASGAFWLGMGLIFTAPVMNLGFTRLVKTRLKGDGSEILPEFLTTLYNAGPMGVTLFFVATGVVILLLGYLWQQHKSRAVEVEESARGASPSGQIALQTQKYLS
jgi:hypothetical protein